MIYLLSQEYLEVVTGCSLGGTHNAPSQYSGLDY
jgi:hypothetical protein